MTLTINDKQKCIINFQATVFFGVVFAKTLSIFNAHYHQHTKFITSINQIESLLALPVPLKKYLDFVHVATDSLISDLQEKFEGPEVTTLITEEKLL